MSKDVLPNVNVMISGAVPKPEHIQPWKEAGRSWIAIQGYGVADVKFDAPDAADKVFAAWSASQGYQHPLMDGIIVDEFGGGDGIEYDVYRQVVERLNATFKPKIYMPYGGRFYGGDRSTKFAQAALDGGGYVCPEYYLIEQPSQPEAEQFIYDSLVSDMRRWENGMPGVIPRVLVVLGYMSQPTESLNVNPSVNFKVYMDMQMRALATHPSCFGLGGLQWYHPWMNYHWRVFTAKETTAKLTVTDWQHDQQPGGPIGQELMFNFIEIQPYIED